MRKSLIFQIIFLIIAFIYFISSFVSTIQESGIRNKNFRDNFDLKFKGVIVDIKYSEHNHADIKIRVVESNKTEYKDPKYLGYEYCNLKDSIANMYNVGGGHALEIGDSVFVGPSDFFLSKCLDDTIIGRKSAWDDLTYRRHNTHREY